MELRAVKGMNDVLPADMAAWHRLEQAYARALTLHGFREVRTPLVESTPLYVRTVGETTDIVEKEMYSFTFHDEALTLRPEGTAGAARAYVEHKVHDKEPVTRWYYAGAMFRGERPARGRYRQFFQAGAEIFGDRGPGCDAELIDMAAGFVRDLGIKDAVVYLSSIGSGDTRARYKAALLEYLEPKKEGLSTESQRRLGINPLRILDSKSPADQEIVRFAPSMIDHLTDDDKAHFDGLRRMLDVLGTPYEVDPRLIRGLDYYTRTLFEIKGAADKLGAGSTLIAGGRYDGMVADLGGPSVPAIGFAAGMERLIIAAASTAPGPVSDVLVAPLGDRAMGPALVLARDLRRLGLVAVADTRGGSLKSQLRRANDLGARFVCILGDAELDKSTVMLKDLAGHAQEEIARDVVTNIVAARLAASGAAHPQGQL